MANTEQKITKIVDGVTPSYQATVKSDGAILVQSGANDPVLTQLEILNSLIPGVYDYISLAYTGSNLTSVEFKSGGVGGTTVSTLTLGYDISNNLTSVTKS